MSTFWEVLIAILLVVGALVVLKWVVSIAFAFFWPLVLIGLGIVAGVWWAGRRRRSRLGSP